MSGVLAVVVDVLGVSWNEESELAVPVYLCFGPSRRRVEDDLDCFLPLNAPHFVYNVLGPKTLLVVGLPDFEAFLGELLDDA